MVCKNKTSDIILLTGLLVIIFALVFLIAPVILGIVGICFAGVIVYYTGKLALLVVRKYNGRVKYYPVRHRYNKRYKQHKVRRKFRHYKKQNRKY